MINFFSEKCFVAFFMFLSCAACQESGTRDGPDPAPETLESGLFLAEIYPMANSTAYLVSSESIYFINGEKAEKVIGVPVHFFGKLVGLPDGSAIYSAAMAEPPGLFRLRGVNVTKISEGNTGDVTRVVPSDEGFYFAEYQRLTQELAEGRRSQEKRRFDEGVRAWE